MVKKNHLRLHLRDDPSSKFRGQGWLEYKKLPGWKCWNGCFLKWWYPTTMAFPKNDHFGVWNGGTTILGNPQMVILLITGVVSRKPPCFRWTKKCPAFWWCFPGEGKWVQRLVLRDELVYMESTQQKTSRDLSYLMCVYIYIILYTCFMYIYICIYLLYMFFIDSFTDSPYLHYSFFLQWKIHKSEKLDALLVSTGNRLIQDWIQSSKITSSSTLKVLVSNRNLLFQGSIFRGYVFFPGGDRFTV